MYARYGFVVLVEYAQGGCDEGTTNAGADTCDGIYVGIAVYGYEPEIAAFAGGLHGEDEAISGFGNIGMAVGIAFQCGAYHSSAACVRGLHIGYKIA